MQVSIRTLIAALGMATGSIAAGCSDQQYDRSPTIGATTPKAAYARVSQDEFHRRNPMDFVGRMNTEFMKQTTEQMIKTLLAEAKGSVAVKR